MLQNSLQNSESAAAAPVRCSVTHRLALKGLGRTYRFMHVTDVHIATAYPDEPERMQKEAELRGGHYFPPFEGFTAGTRFPFFFREAENSGMDGILLTGDICDFPSRSNLDILKSGLENSGVPAVYCMGNHDWTFLENYQSDSHKDEFIPEYYGMVNHRSDAAGKISSGLLPGSVFWKLADFGEFLVFAFDNGRNRVLPETVEAFKDVLAAGRPVILSCHVPFYSPTLREPTVDYWHSDILLGGTEVHADGPTQEFIDLMKAPDSPVRAVVAGHIHFDHEDMLNENIVQFTTTEGHRGGYGMIELDPA